LGFKFEKFFGSVAWYSEKYHGLVVPYTGKSSNSSSFTVRPCSLL